MNFMMGSSSKESIVGIKKCEGGYWIIQVVFILICVGATFLSVKLAKRD